jgi:C4-dicarboxylate-specific signal transduction histidine kinase
MPFLYQHKYSEIGAVVCMIMLSALTFLSCTRADGSIIAATLPFIFMLSMLLIMWWHNSLLQSYLFQLKKNEIDVLSTQLSQKAAQIDALKKDNEQLAYIVHKDNKLIPAMELSVRTLLDVLTKNKDPLPTANTSDSFQQPSAATDTHAHATQLLKELEHLSKERKGTLPNAQASTVPFAKTGFIRIDSILSYMYERACSMNISFSFEANCDLHDYMNHFIQESDLATILADLIENALIATKEQYVRKILLVFHADKTSFELLLYDSGVPFGEEVLSKMGKEKVTTHAADGGSGIGLMTIHNIVKKYNGMLKIEQPLPKEADYTTLIRIVCNTENTTSSS